MAWRQFGFGSGSVIPGGGSGGSGGTGGSGSGVTWHLGLTPTTSDNVTFQLPTAFPIVTGTLSFKINGMVQSPDDFLVLPDGKSFQWQDNTNPLDFPADFRVDFATP